MAWRRWPVRVSRGQRDVLEAILRRRTAAQRLVLRAECILKAAEGYPNHVVSERIGLSPNQVGMWCRRWRSARRSLEAAESENPAALRTYVEEVLDDAARSGAPPTFSREQAVQIAAIAQERPEESGRPVTHWTPREIAQEAKRRGIVKTISARQVERFLKDGPTPAPSQSPLA